MSDDLKIYKDENKIGNVSKKLFVIMFLWFSASCVVVTMLYIAGFIEASFTALLLILAVAFFISFSPAVIFIILYTKKQTEKEYELFVELATEEERYRLAFENSKDLIYEYDFANGALSCFGNYEDESGQAGDMTRFTGTLESMVLNGDYVYHEDIQKVVDFKNGKTSESFAIRLRRSSESPYRWYMVEGSVVSDNEKPVRLVGKLRDIDREKQQEKEFLENSKKDDATGFYTWDVGAKIIESKLDGSKKSVMFMFFKILNMGMMDEDYGTIFADALIVHVANVLKSSTREEDTLIRINRSAFAAVLPDISSDGMMMMHTGIERQLEHMYTGADNTGGLDYIIRFFDKKSDLENAAASELQADDPGLNKVVGIRYDTVSFAFNILEHTRDINSAMGMLLEYIGSQFNVTAIHVMEKEETPGVETCLFEWRSGPMSFGAHPGERRETDPIDMEHIYEMFANHDFVILDRHALISLTDKTRGRYLRNHTSHLLVAMLSGGECVGVIDYEHLNPEYLWPEETSATLNEVTRVISTYILKNKSDNASRAKSDFLSSMSHEIRTPMNAISGFSELILAEKDLNENTRKYANDIKASSESLISIINDILDFSKIEAGKFEIVEGNYRLSSMLNDVYSIIGVRIGEKGIALDVITEGKIPDGLVGDESRVKQVFLNILNNAVKFTNKGSITLTISWEKQTEDSGILHASVKDTGIGIKEDDLERIFESFSQVDIVRNKSIKGTGLGLAICKNLVGLMGGKINAVSTYGQGTTFSFSFKQKIYDDSDCIFDPNNLKRIERKAFTVPFIAPEARVLIVDDNKVNLEVAKGLLGQYKSHVYAALSGEEALDIIFREEPFDIIFMDHMMPKMDGVETTAHIRHREMGGNNVPIIALTANAIKGADKLFLDAGMNDYISKPIDLRLLASVMDRWLPEEKKIRDFDAGQETKENESQSEGGYENTAGQAAASVGDDIVNEGEFSVLKGIDASLGLSNCLGDSDTYSGLLKTFIDSDSYNEANKFYLENDLENYKITVHGLKSAANYIGASKLSAYAKMLEMFAKDGDSKSIDRDHPGLKPLYTEVADSIVEFLGGQADDSKEINKTEIGKDEVLQLTENLLGFIEDMDLDAVSRKAEEMAGLKYDNEEINELINGIVNDASNFDFDEAAQKAEKIKMMLTQSN
ncbi:MAG: response regulator [Lachnospiraceae bacterium]|nr:response regulator [Lachnospiraceae bacterium]